MKIPECDHFSVNFFDFVFKVSSVFKTIAIFFFPKIEKWYPQCKFNNRDQRYFFSELLLSLLMTQFYFSKKDELVPMIKLEMCHTPGEVLGITKRFRKWSHWTDVKFSTMLQHWSSIVHNTRLADAYSWSSSRKQSLSLLKKFSSNFYV